MRWVAYLEGGPQRVNHAAVAIDSEIYSFGGFSSHEGELSSGNIDLYVLDTDTLRWKCVNYKGDKIPFQRYGHTVVAYNRKIYLWGGRNDLNSSNTLHCFDIDTLTWSAPSTSGAVPFPTDGHSACVIDNFMYIFGGFQDDTGRFSQSVSRLNLLTFHWEEVETSGIPPDRRDFHTASAIGHRMYIFGGRSGTIDDGDMNDDIKSEFYDNQIMYLNTRTMEWVKPDCLGWPPCGRRSHSAVVYENELYIIGGYNGITQNHLNDIHKFNPMKNEWVKICTLGEGPCPRRRHCACVVEKQLYLFGGSSPHTDKDRMDGYQKLVDHSDLYVLDFEPNLKRLCQLAIIKFGLKIHHLPKILIKEIQYLTTNNKITKNDFYPRKDYGVFSFSA